MFSFMPWLLRDRALGKNPGSSWQPLHVAALLAEANAMKNDGQTPRSHFVKRQTYSCMLPGQERM